tara:strand:- start:6050 stop:6382 length:333 start_codon:yes stop_codon:yes gene_type:complete
MTDGSVEAFASFDVNPNMRLNRTTTLPRILQKPIGVGCFIGFLTGVANSIFLGIPSLYSVPFGILLGMTVCIVASPAMRHQLNQARREQSKFRGQLMNRKGRKNAFTTYD